MVVDQGKEKKRSILMKTECSLQQLAFEVENVYNAFRCQYPFGDKEVNEIKKAILTRSYVLSPLRLVVLPIEFPKSKFLHVFTIPAMPNVYFVAIAESKDALVFIALSRVLSLTLDSYGAFLEHSFALKKKGGGINAFYDEVRNCGKVNMLLYFDLTPSLNTLSRFRLVTKVRPVLNDPFLFQLVSSFLNFSLLD